MRESENLYGFLQVIRAEKNRDETEADRRKPVKQKNAGETEESR